MRGDGTTPRLKIQRLEFHRLSGVTGLATMEPGHCVPGRELKHIAVPTSEHSASAHFLFSPGRVLGFDSAVQKSLGGTCTCVVTGSLLLRRLARILGGEGAQRAGTGSGRPVPEAAMGGGFSGL